ncbi:MAG TPA: type VI secretion system baseplate subunit TssG [Polyangiales bacterium]|nr:type VI secretion system baseplate subunit TssG [Polyangiales bacterium]
MRELALRALDEAQRLPFVSLVRWLEHGLGGAAAVGGDGPLEHEPIQFSCSPALAFASAELDSAELRDDRAHLSLHFGGLVGAGSPLPPSMLEDFAALDDDTSAERAFLDLFHHRMFGLTYRGLLKFDLARSRFGRAPALDWILGLSGVPAEDAERISGLPRAMLWRLTPLLVAYPANAERIAVALQVVFEDLELPVTVHELRGGTVAIEARFRAKLGRDLQLGRNFTLGSRAPAPSSAITVVLGPLAPELAATFAPGGERRSTLEATVALLCPETIDVELELRLTHGAPAALGRVRLGRSAWLGTGAQPAPVRWRVDGNRGGNAWTSPH